jgi:capsular polysaccharide biosynthesis protein
MRSSHVNSGDFVLLSDSDPYRKSQCHSNLNLVTIGLAEATARIVIRRLSDAKFYSDVPLVFDRDGLVPETCYLIDAASFESGRLDYPEQFLNDEVCYCVGYNSTAVNYYHWMMQCLPAIYSYTLVDSTLRKAILIPDYQGFQKQALELAGLDLEFFFVEPQMGYNIPRALISNYLQGVMAYSPSPLAKPLFDTMRDAALARQRSHGRAELVYVSRSDTPNRPLINEDALMDSLSRLGFEMLVCSKLSLVEQISAFASAETIVAPHGAGLTNIAFCKPSCKIYELTPDHYVNSCFLNLAQMQGNEYWLECHPAIGEGSHHQRAWEVDVAKITRNVENILRRVDC